MESAIKDQAETTQLLLAINYFSNYRYFRESLLWNEYINLENIISDLTYGQYESIRQMIEVEEIVNAIQYCLDLGAIAICVDKRGINELGYKLANLDEKSITDFYANIENQKIDQIKRYMGYHDIITNKNKNYKYIRSCKKFQVIISELAQFFNLYYDLYLSYKHGLRIAPLGCKNGKYVYGITDGRYNKNRNFRSYEIPILLGINSSMVVCDSIKDIFDKLYIPIIRKFACEFMDINNEALDALDLEGNIIRNIKTENSLIHHPTYKLSMSYTHPWWNFKKSSLKPFF
jgi:hypothetical protein